MNKFVSHWIYVDSVMFTENMKIKTFLSSYIWQLDM